ncbi:(2Fe-2S)-binding protein [uncultured Croceitalea sp.]|uniref:(2Fe-2S)-binding protein n=1 Tax=uncultured Croceitalea sp. TaxID=1798908 RepID=UPI0033061DC7
MPRFTLNINDREYTVEAPEKMPILWALRDKLNLTGSKFGCGIGQCGACTIHADGTPIRGCCVPIKALEGKVLRTIEGISVEHPVKESWRKLDVAQCGYCQTGQIMSAVALLDRKPEPTEEEINRAMKGNICRCGTYNRIKNAIMEASKNRIA